MRDLNDKVALITGAGSGIGRALAAELAERGAHLVLADINEADLAQTAEQVVRADRRLSQHRVDVSDRGAVFALADEVADLHGGADLVINNAGITFLSSFTDQDLDSFERVLDINFRGVVYGCKAFLDQVKASRGHLVNISSMAAFVGMPYQSAYCSSKFAVRGFSESLRAELAKEGVGVTCVCPGSVRTNIIASAGANDLTAHEKLSGLMADSRLLASPERVARRILGAVRSNKPELKVCPDSHLLDWTRRTSPGFTRWLMRTIHNRLSDS